MTAEGYVGDDVHFAARVAAAGHGGQVICSAATAALVDRELTDLGSHRLKDIAEPVSIYQLGDGCLPAAQDDREHEPADPRLALPGPRGRAVRGRPRCCGDPPAHDLRAGRPGQDTLRPGARPHERARSASRTTRTGVFACFLASLRDPSLVLPTICQTLSVREQPGRSALEALVGPSSRERRCSSSSTTWSTCSPARAELARAPRARVRASPCSSPRASSCASPASAPTRFHRSHEEEGIALFCERARVEPSPRRSASSAHAWKACRSRSSSPPRACAFSAPSSSSSVSRSASTCSRAAATPIRASRRCARRSSGATTCSRPTEQTLFARLSVFAGGCTLEAQRRCADADLDTLAVARSTRACLRLHRRPRFWMLETIREYAGERLETSGEEDSRRERHLAWYASLAIELAEPVRKYSPQALAALEHELDNMRAALAVAVDRDEVVPASDLMTGLWFYWLSSGRGEEARAWAERYLASSRQSVGALERFGGDLAVAEILRFTGDHATAADLKRESVATGRAHPNTVIHGVAIERSIAATLSDLAYIEVDAGRFDEAAPVPPRRSLSAASWVCPTASRMRCSPSLPSSTTRATSPVPRALCRGGGPLRRQGGLAATRSRHGSSRRNASCCSVGWTRRRPCSETGSAARSLQDLSFEVLALRVAAMLAAAKGEAERSAILFGALDANLQEGGLTLFGPVEEELKRPYLERLRRRPAEHRRLILCGALPHRRGDLSSLSGSSSRARSARARSGSRRRASAAPRAATS